MNLNVKKVPGFTMIELLIVVAIVGILAAVAYPNYTSSIQKSRRGDATNYLLMLQMEQEKYRANNLNYAGTFATLFNDSSATTIDSPDGYYEMTISTVIDTAATTFTATATAKTGGSQASDTDCTEFTINQSGPVGGAACWSN